MILLEKVQLTLSALFGGQELSPLTILEKLPWQEFPPQSIIPASVPHPASTEPLLHPVLIAPKWPKYPGDPPDVPGLEGRYSCRLKKQLQRQRPTGRQPRRLPYTVPDLELRRTSGE